MLSKKSNSICFRTFLVVFILLFGSFSLHAQNKKKKTSDANIIARGYNDVTTRNNYYFNANNTYKEILNSVEANYEINYDEILPLFFHQNVEDFESFSGDLESIIKRTSEVMQLHDNTRWKDNVYLLLGKARYLSGDYKEALKTFQFVVTTMKEDVGKQKGKVDNKSIAKNNKSKEAAKAAAQRKKEIAKKKAEIKAQFQKLKRDKEKEIAAKNKAKKKALDKKIKAKKKVIALRQKGKTPPQKLLDIANGKSDEKEEVLAEKEVEKEKKSKEQEAEEAITYKVTSRSDRKEQKMAEAEAARELAAMNDTLPMTNKEIKKYNDLSLWQKIRHKRSRSEAIVWMAKSYLALGEYENAQSMLEYAEALPKLTRKQRLEIFSGEAYYYIESNRYENAIESLDNAILYAKKKQKSKYKFVKAQLQERLNNYPNAVDTYQEIAKGKANYEMKFYANMKAASIYESEQLTDSETLIALLTKMLKDGANREFRDQIHYSLASIYAKNGDLEQAKEQLQSSITNSRSNPLQKGLSFKELGEVYLIEENYNASKLFFDSAVAIIPNTYEAYDKIKFKGETIGLIAIQAAIISEQDSLLMLSKFSDADMELYLAELEKQNRGTNISKKRKQTSVTDFINEAVIATPGATGFNTGEWYFYNASLKSQGLATFKDIWGEIALEPNWRRGEKSGQFEIADDERMNINPFQKQEEEVKAPVKKDLKIPKTDEEIAAANQKLYSAHYELGKLFRNQLEVNGEAKQSFEAIANKYPSFKSIDRVYYYLYLIYADEGDMARADYFKNILLKEYPVSQYAVAFNTTYTFDRDNEQKRPDPVGIEKLYASTYASFQEGAYQEVINRRAEAYATYQENALMPKFDFLEALSYGHLDSISVLKSKLTNIITQYPNHEIEKKAREYLAYLNQKENEINVPVDTTIIETDTGAVELVTVYTNEESTNIFAMIILKNKNDDIRTMIQVLEQYNTNKFDARKLRVSNAFLDKDTPMILVKRFREKSTAIEYLADLNTSMVEVFGDNAKNLELLMISQENFRILFTSKKIEDYRNFFKQTYNQ